MEARTLQSLPAEHLEDLGHLLAHLKADPQAAEFVAGVEAARDALETRSEDWRSNCHAVREMHAGLENAEEALHHAVRTGRDVILADVRHRRSAPKFQIYFPRGIRAITKSPYLDQLVSVRAIAERCAKDPNPRIREQAGALRAAADEMSAAYQRRAQALAAKSSSSGLLQEQKIQTVETCRRISNRLSELYPNQWDRVRSYFRQVRRPSRSAQHLAEAVPLRGHGGSEAPALRIADPPGAPVPSAEV